MAAGRAAWGKVGPGPGPSAFASALSAGDTQRPPHSHPAPHFSDHQGCMSQARGGDAELRLAGLDPKSRTCQVALSPRPRPQPVRAGAGTAVRAHSALRDPDSPFLPGDTRSALSTGRGAGEGSDQAESELEKPPCLRLWRSVFLNRGEQSTVRQPSPCPAVT